MFPGNFILLLFSQTAALSNAAVWHPGHMYSLQFDGMLRTAGDERFYKNGLLGYGWLIKKNEIEIAHGFGLFARNCSAGSSVAEYLALIEGLDALTDLRVWDCEVEIRGDAKCVIDQMKGVTSVSSPFLRQLKRHAKKLTYRFKFLSWTWVPRCENKQADALSRRGLRYLDFASPSKQKLDGSQPAIIYNGSLISIVDLRVHAHIM